MRYRLRLAGVAAAALLAAGCFWPAAGAGPGRNAHNVFEDQITVETVGDLEKLWAAHIAPEGWSVGQPVTSNRAVHVTLTINGGGSIVVTLDRADGDVLWDLLPGLSEASPLIFANDSIWLGGMTDSGAGYTQRVDPDTGRLSPVRPGLPGLVNGVRGNIRLTNVPHASSPSGESHIVGVANMTDSSGDWFRIIDTVPPGETAEYSPLTLGNDYVLQAGPGTFWDGSGPDSGFSRGNGIRGYSIEDPVDCAPAEGFVCPDWSSELDGTTATSPVVAREEAGIADDIVYTGTDAGTVYAVDATNGDILWSTAVGSAVESEPALADGVLYVPTDGNGLIALEAATGDEMWTADLGSPTRTQPAVAGGVVFVGTEGGTVSAFDASGCGEATCEPLWSDTIGASITGAPAIDRGQLYVGTQHGRLISYGLP